MAQVNKIDSNITGLAYIEEDTIGSDIIIPPWRSLEPNSYSDFGGELTTVSPNPINPSRQRKKGILTDLDATCAFNHNLTSENLKDLLQGFMFADIRRKPNAFIDEVVVPQTGNREYRTTDITGFQAGQLIKGFGFTNPQNNQTRRIISVSNTGLNMGSATIIAEDPPADTAYVQVVGYQGIQGQIQVDITQLLPRLTSATLDFRDLSLIPGEWIYVGGDISSMSFNELANNGFKRIRSIAQREIVIDKSAQTMVAANATNTSSKSISIYYGDVLRNETGIDIKRRSYHFERTLGASDSARFTEIQSEIIKGAVANELTLNIPTADIVNMDLGFIGIDHIQRSGGLGPLRITVESPEAADIFNTSSDFSRLKMSSVSDTEENPDALFVFITEASITINNNLTSNKAVTHLGAFDITAGTFQVGGSVTAYFSDVASIAAVRQNSNISLDMILVKGNQGIVVDMPLISLGDGRLNVEQDQPITLPLTMEAASGEDISSGLDHTLLFTFFKYLPNVAE